MTVTVTEHLWVPLADGTRLAARLWLPQGAEATPVPAVLEYIPYRKRDGTRARDEPMHGYFAGAGYAAIRVDMRGSGESDGLLDDEYIRQEQDDALEVIDWISRQSWCSGAVGMMGKSWGGFNCLQVAMRRPPALKAILTVCSTTDRFANDIHYMGGSLLNDNHWWGAIMLAFQARPADPLLRHDWREQWIERLNHMPFWPALWLAHQRRDAYWKHGSVCEDWNAIQCPVMAVGGWADSYTDAVPELLAHLKVPRLGLIGPWAHIYPQDGVPGPAIGFLQEAVRWWDHWLKGEDRGIMAEPMLRAFVEDGQSPVSTTKTAAHGRWRGEGAWPSPAIADTPFHPLLGGGLSTQAAPGGRLAFRSPLYTGTTCGEWMGTGVTGDMPGDQRFDDGLSQIFETEPLEEAIEILGHPVAELSISSDKAIGQLAVRLCDVSPNGASQRVSYGVLNLAHRAGSEEPKPMPIGDATPIRLRMKICGHRFAKGHRIRFALSTAYWPILWPAAEAAELTLHLAGSRFTLPIRPAEGPELPVAFSPPAHGPFAAITKLSESRLTRRVTIDTMTDTATYETVGEGGLFGEGVFRFDEIDLAMDHGLTRRLSVQADDPLSAVSAITQYFAMGREGWRIRIETETEMTGTAAAFRMTGKVRAYENGELVVERLYDQSFARDHV